MSKRIGEKVAAAAHQEYNDQDTLKEARDRLLLGQDMFGRDAAFKRVEVDGSYPAYLLRHIEEYRYLILPPVGPARRIFTKVSMKPRRFARRALRKIKRILRR